MSEDTAEEKRRKAMAALAQARAQAQRKDPSPEFTEKMKKQQARSEGK
jgi:hypothetical protein